MSFPVMWGGPQIQGAPSLIENQQPFGQAIPTHFVEWFDGATLDNIWSTSQGSGSGGSVSMKDAIDGGLSMFSGTGSGSSFVLHFNDVARHYSPTGCEFISVTKWVETTDVRTLAGLTEGFGDLGSDDHLFFLLNAQDDTFQELLHNDGSGLVATTDTTANTTSSITETRLRLEASAGKVWVDGDFSLVVTADLPAQPQQPIFQVNNEATTTNAEISVVYCEVWNNEV